MLSWKHGPIIAGVVAVGLAGAVILAKGNAPRPQAYQAAVDASDDLFGEAPMASPTNAAPANVPVNAAPANTAPAPTNSSPPAEASLVEEPSEPNAESIATFVCKNRNGDARKPIQCDGRKTVHAWLTVSLKKRLPAPATVTLDEYDVSLAGTGAPRATGRHVLMESDIDIRAAKGAIMRITYTPAELKAWNVAAKKLAIAAYDVPTSRWIVLPSAVNQRTRFVQASFATKRLPNQLFALVSKP